jgi:hypothetical protein
MISKASEYRERAANAAAMASTAHDKPQRNRYERMETAWLALAEEQDWLDRHVMTDSK